MLSIILMTFYLPQTQQHSVLMCGYSFVSIFCRLIYSVNSHFVEFYCSVSTETLLYNCWYLKNCNSVYTVIKQYSFFSKDVKVLGNALQYMLKGLMYTLLVLCLITISSRFTTLKTLIKLYQLLKRGSKVGVIFNFCCYLIVFNSVLCCIINSWTFMGN